jgi:hypothetical protein
MQEPGPIELALEEHAEHLKIQSDEMSALRKDVNALRRVVASLAKMVEMEGTALANVDRLNYFQSDHWKNIWPIIHAEAERLGAALKELG